MNLLKIRFFLNKLCIEIKREDYLDDGLVKFSDRKVMPGPNIDCEIMHKSKPANIFGAWYGYLQRLLHYLLKQHANLTL